jgi:CRISPR type I-E-associated protein CasB/Cse2
MSNLSEHVAEFINQLKEWGQRETGPQRTAMAELRRGLQEFPHLNPYMHQYVAPFAGYTKGWRKETYYLTAALFARYHSGSKAALYGDEPWLNMGSYFAEVVKDEPLARESIERRFNALLTAHPQDLHYHLRQAIAFLHSKSEVTIAINWNNLFWDIWQWDDDDKRPEVQDKWAMQFWRSNANTKETNSQIETTN